MKQELNNIKNAIISANKKNNVTKQLWPFQRLILGSGVFADEFVDFIIEILSNELLFDKAGIEDFIVNLASDMDRLTADQKARILNAISNNYTRYKSDIFCWCVCDYLARNFPESIAFKIFEKFAREAQSISNKRGIVLGLDILIKNSPNKANSEKIAIKISNIIKEGRL